MDLRGRIRVGEARSRWRRRGGGELAGANRTGEEIGVVTVLSRLFKQQDFPVSFYFSDRASIFLEKEPRFTSGLFPSSSPSNWQID